jgi:hypothetical protein
LPKIAQDGFYRINLNPQLAPYINDEYSNIRIHDRNNHEVPYFIQAEQGRTHVVTFEEYIIQEKARIKDSCSVIILSNTGNTTISNISLVIKNAEVTKEAILTGSDDGETWYALKEKVLLSNIDNTSETAEVKIVDFPLSNYKYYKIWISDKASDPLNVLKAGYYKTSTEDARYLEVPKPRSSQSENTVQKTSRIDIAFDTVRFIDKISWSVTGSPYYLRSATLYAERTNINKKGKTEKYLDHLADFQLNSRQENVLFLPAVKVQKLVLVVENEDNPPLNIGDVHAYQLSQYLVAWLKKDDGYTLKFGNQSMQPPVYDLPFFQDSIKSTPPTLQAGAITSLLKPEPMDAPSLFTTNSIIWGAIILIIVMLGLMSMKLVRETNAQSKNS